MVHSVPSTLYFEWISLQTSILREYLALEMKSDDLPFPFDPERILDDFVFMCFFVGEWLTCACENATSLSSCFFLVGEWLTCACENATTLSSCVSLSVSG